MECRAPICHLVLCRSETLVGAMASQTLAHQRQHFLPPLEHPTGRECFGFVVVWYSPLYTPDLLSVGIGGVKHCAIYPLTLVVALELARDPDKWCCTTQIRALEVGPIHYRSVAGLCQRS